MKKWSVVCISFVVLVLLSCGGGAPNDSVVTDNIDKYPFLCDGFQYTVHLVLAFPRYVCADYYRWGEYDINGETWLMAYINTSDEETEILSESSLAAITHVGGSVVEFGE